MGIRIYADFWRKYRPVILRLMVDAEKEPQQYQFLRHELHDVTPTKKSGYSFKMDVLKGRAQNNIKTSDLAKDLLATLQRSNKAAELTEMQQYSFTLDKYFVLHVTREAMEGKTSEEEVTPEDVVSEVSTEDNSKQD